MVQSYKANFVWLVVAALPACEAENAIAETSQADATAYTMGDVRAADQNVDRDVGAVSNRRMDEAVDSGVDAISDTGVSALPGSGVGGEPPDHRVGPAGEAGVDAEPDAAFAGAAPELRWCVGKEDFVPAPARGWAHGSSKVAAALDSNSHSAQDVIAAEHAPVMVAGRFSYGSLAIPVVDEPVQVSLRTCAGWELLGETSTDNDGHISLPLARELPIGVYDLRQQLMGDASTISSTIWVLPAGTHFVVVDIDGTLTTSDTELVTEVITDWFRPIASGDYVPNEYPGAATLTQAHRQVGHVVLYLTGRPYWLTDTTRSWLSAVGATLGPIHTTDSNSEALPTEDGVGAYKRDFLRGLVGSGFALDIGYGNSLTDIHAWLGAGLAASSFWIIGTNGGAEGTHAVVASWEPRAAEVLTGPSVSQPFRW